MIGGFPLFRSIIWRGFMDKAAIQTGIKEPPQTIRPDRVYQSPRQRQTNLTRTKTANFYELREDNCFTNIALAQWFDNVALFVIVCNALWIGVEVDQNPSNDPTKTTEKKDGITVFEVMENVFSTGGGRKH